MVLNIFTEISTGNHSYMSSAEKHLHTIAWAIYFAYLLMEILSQNLTWQENSICQNINGGEYLELFQHWKWVLWFLRAIKMFAYVHKTLDQTVHRQQNPTSNWQIHMHYNNKSCSFLFFTRMDWVRYYKLWTHLEK